MASFRFRVSPQRKNTMASLPLCEKFLEEMKTSPAEDYSTQRREYLCVLQGNGKDFLSALWRGLQQGTTSARDIQMKFKDDKEMCINRTVLSNMGQYFQVMLDCGLRETQENKVTLPTVTQLTFTRLMAFTLGQKVEIKTREELVELLEAAEMMQIQSLVDACIERLQVEMNGINCLETFVMVRRFRPHKVQRAASLVVSHIKRVAETDEWCSLEEEDIAILVKTWSTKFIFPFRSPGVTEVFDTVLRWIETNGADQDSCARLLGLMNPGEIINSGKKLLDHSVLLKNASVMKAVQEWLKPKAEIALLVVGSAERPGDVCTDSYIYCWSENFQEWVIFPPPRQELPKDFAVIKKNHKTLIISGGMSEKTGPSNNVWTADESRWQEIGRLVTARSRHGMVAIGDDLYFAGGLPGPLKSIEIMNRSDLLKISEEVGDLPEAVYDCAVAAVKGKLIVVGGCSSEGPRNIIQTFHTVSRAAQVITLPESPGVQLDLGFTRYVGILDSLLFLSRSGHLLEVKVEGRTVTLQGQVLLKDFHHQSPFAAVLDSGGVVVCDSRSADCRYSLDGEKKEETAVIRRLRDDTQVHGVFRFFISSADCILSRLTRNQMKTRFQRLF